jgi:hypothetical protein
VAQYASRSGAAGRKTSCVAGKAHLEVLDELEHSLAAACPGGRGLCRVSTRRRQSRASPRRCHSPTNNGARAGRTLPERTPKELRSRSSLRRACAFGISLRTWPRASRASKCPIPCGSKSKSTVTRELVPPRRRARRGRCRRAVAARSGHGTTSFAAGRARRSRS